MDNNNKDSSRIQGTKMKCLWSILWKTGRDRIQNTKVWEIFNLDKIKESEIRWYDHVERMNTGRGYKDKHWNID